MINCNSGFLKEDRQIIEKIIVIVIIIIIMIIIIIIIILLLQDSVDLELQWQPK